MVRNERGSTLALALVFIVVVAMFGGMVVKGQYTTQSVEITLTDKRSKDLIADGAIDVAIQALKANTTLGRADEIDKATDKCDDPALTGALGDLVLYHDGIFVTCTPADGQSGDLPMGDEAVPESTIITLGGTLGRGQFFGDTSASGMRDIPFCDDFHDPSNTRCEAGLFIGRSEDDPNEIGGVLITSNGSDSGKPLIQSNSSIMIKGTDPDRKLLVMGTVQARRRCDHLYNRVRVNVTQTVPGGVIEPGTDDAGGPLDCQRDPAGLGTGTDAFIPDPNYQHEYWDKRITPTNASSPPALMTPQPVPDYDNGTIDDCQSRGMVKFAPGYYNDLIKLNKLMVDCTDAFFWFEPGTYYFDWDLDLPGITDDHWRAPATSAYPSQIVGGKPRAADDWGWDPAWMTCPYPDNPALATGADIAKCTQPPKLMTPDVVQTVQMGGLSTYDWATIDRVSRKRTMTSNGEDILYDRFETKIPELRNAKVETVKVRFRHAVAAGSVGSFEPGFPRLKFTTPGGATCTKELTEPTGLTIEEFDLTNGCPAGGSTNQSWTAANTWSPNMVNDITVRYELDRLGTSLPTVEVDGVEMVVTYRGRPAPAFPHGCDTADDGVQFIFGNEARMKFNTGRGTVELCADQSDFDPTGIGISVYGLDEDAAGQPRVWESKNAQRTHFNAAPQHQHFVAHPTPARTPALNEIATINEDANGPNDLFWWVEPVDNQLPARMQYQLSDFSMFPAGTVFEHARVRVRHQEGPAPGTPIANQFTYARLEIAPASGSGKFVRDLTLSNREFSDANWIVDDIGNDITSVEWAGTNQTVDTTLLTPTVDYAERELLVAMNTAAKWNGATVSYEVQANNSAGNQVAYLDGIEITLEYRPPGMLRPLRGCMTIRTGDNPFEALTRDGEPKPWDGTEEGAPGEQGRPYTGVEHNDWGRFNSGSRITDDAYGRGNGSSGAGGDESGDAATCALIKAVVNSQHNQRTHFEGTMYAPTAAFDLTGNDNDAAFASGGIVARHLSLWRWLRGGFSPAVGGDEVGRENRRVTLNAWDGAPALGKLILTVEVEIDEDGLRDETIAAYDRRPGG